MMLHVPDESRLDVIPKLLSSDIFSLDVDVVLNGLEELTTLCYNAERHSTFQSMKADNTSIITTVMSTGTTIHTSPTAAAAAAAGSMGISGGSGGGGGVDPAVHNVVVLAADGKQQQQQQQNQIHSGHSMSTAGNVPTPINKKSTVEYIEYQKMVLAQEEVESINRATIRDFGGHLAIVVIMKRWSSNAYVQSTACKALFYASYPYDPTTEAFQDLAVHVGAMEVIISALELYKTDDTVQLWGLRALVNLAWYERNYVPLVLEKVGGIDVFVTAMNTFPMNINIQRIGCLFLVKIIENKNNTDIREVIVKAGARRVLLAAIENHPEDTTSNSTKDVSECIQRNARHTMKELCEFEDQPRGSTSALSAAAASSSSGAYVSRKGQMNPTTNPSESAGITSLFKKINLF